MSGKVESKKQLEFRQVRESLLEQVETERQDYYLQALQKANDLAVMFKQKYKVKRVYLYGSLVWGGFDQHSDLDLFLVGFEGNYWKAFSDAEAIAAPIQVSLACEEDCLESLKEKVMKKGVLL